MAFSDSKVFTAFIIDMLSNSAAYDLNNPNVDTFKVALYNNSVNPVNTVAASLARYGVGDWATNEVSSGSAWSAGGRTITNPAVAQSSPTTIVKWSGDSVASNGTVSLQNFAGCLVYDDTLTSPQDNPAICYNYFGGVNTVVNGTFTIVWSSTGIMTFTT